jgi:uncharacterized protein YifE (UPF0438 family)
MENELKLIKQKRQQMLQLKKCCTCNTSFTIDNFYRNKHYVSGYSYNCKECDKKAQKIWRQNNRKKALKLSKNWKDNNQDKVYIAKLKREYNLSIEEFENMFVKQNKKCAICEINIEKPYLAEKFESAYVDHCHLTNKVRGLLCQYCNTGIGFFKDNVNFLNQAINYLNTSNEDGKDSQ